MGISLDSDQLHRKIATEIGVPLGDVKMMDGRLSGSDYSLNATQSTDEEGREWIETLEDDSEGADSLFEQAHDNAYLRKCLLNALSTLNDRERLIVRERAIREDTRTLESLGKELCLSKERIRQIEAAAFQKLRKYLRNNMAEVAHYL